VLYKEQYYYCTENHVKSDVGSNPLTLAANNKYWKVGDKIDFVATKILLASYALIKNLGVENVYMTDADGNEIFYARDGNVRCNVGTFKNIAVTDASISKGTIDSAEITNGTIDSVTITNAKVTGDLVARALYLKFGAGLYSSSDCSMYISISAITLENLPEGTARTIRIYNPVVTREDSIYDLTLTAADSNVYISDFNSPKTISGAGINSGKQFELIGYHQEGESKTKWLIREIADTFI
jgi:hypothetical protein